MLFCFVYLFTCFVEVQKSIKIILIFSFHLFRFGATDGTTDVTRTIHLGKPKPLEIEAFTRVLKGFIALSTSIFPPKAPVGIIIYVKIVE